MCPEKSIHPSLPRSISLMPRNSSGNANCRLRLFQVGHVRSATELWQGLQTLPRD